MFITELGSPNEHVVELSAQGVRLSIKHSIMQKSVLQEALRRGTGQGGERE